MEKHTNDYIDEFRRAMLDAGLVTKDIIPDGQIHRCDTNERNGKGDGAYVLHIENHVIVGGFENHQAGTGWCVWKPDRKNEIISPAAKRKMEEALAAMRAKREAETIERKRRSAELASSMWSEARPAEQNHPYLARKGVRAHEGVRVGKWKINGSSIDNALLIPITDGENILSLQAIFPDKANPLGRDKTYLSGGQKTGGYFPLGDVHDVVVVCEGYATGATIHEATDLPVAIAFDSNNLAPVSINLRAKYPLARIIVAADNDHRTEGNPGIHAANKVLQAISNSEVKTPEFDIQDLGTDWNDYAQRHGMDAVRQQFVSSSKKRESLFVSVGDLVGDIKPIQWLVEDYIEEDSLALVFGSPGSGKSFVTVDFAACVATGTPWHGRPVTPGTVFYIAGEGHNGLARRFAAWQSDNQVSLKDKPLYKSKKAISMYNMESALSLYEEIKAMAEETGQKPKLVVIDTLARNFGDGDENSTEDMGKFIENLDTYIRVPFGCNILLVHHSGHNMDRARGSSALKAALDAEYQVTKEDGVVVLSATKMKDAEQPPDMAFRFKVVELGEINGVDITSVVLEENGNPLDVQLTVNSAGESISAQDLCEVVQRGWLPFSQLKDSFNCTQSAIQRAVKKAAEKGLLIKEGQGYKLTEKASNALSLTGRSLVKKDKPFYKRGQE